MSAQPPHVLNVNGTVRAAVVDAEGNVMKPAPFMDPEEMDNPPTETVMWEPRGYPYPRPSGRY